MKRTLLSWLVCALAFTAAHAGERWLHIRVAESGAGENLRLDVPLRFAEGLLASMGTSEWTDEGLDLGGHGDVDGAQLREILAALDDAPDSEFVTLRDGDGSLRVAKERGFLIVHIEERGDGESVRVRVPLAVVSAALSGPHDEIDIAAALRALETHGDVDLVRVEGRDGTVRVWVDANKSGD